MLKTMFGLFKNIFGDKGHVAMPIYFYNTLGKEKQQFAPPERGAVRFYRCGPTVYDTQHIGNLLAPIMADILRRTLTYNGLEVKTVINITDFGHLTSDADEGEDKMAKGLKREGMAVTMENMLALAEKYTEEYLTDIQKLNVPTQEIQFPRASEYIDAQIALIKTLEEKGYTYTTSDGVYFDTSRFPTYGELGGVNAAELQEGARVATNTEKRNPTDFALWKTSSSHKSDDDAQKNADTTRLPVRHRTQTGKDAEVATDSGGEFGWDSPWGRGFPGWHIECSAMIHALLGKQIDIHSGGIEHIPIHHNNEIAQSEAATGRRPFARFWLHNAHIQLDDRKIAKSEGSVVYLSDIIEKGFHPLTYRYWLLTGHYRTPMNFTWEALGGAQTALLRLHKLRAKVCAGKAGKVSAKWQQQFHKHINDDLDTAGALATLWDMTKDDALSPADVGATLLDFDKVLGIGLTEPGVELTKMLASEFGEQVEVGELPEDVQHLVQEREAARAVQNWQRADDLREQISHKGYDVKDTNDGAQVVKR